jgi:microcystin-dependent protein
MGPPGPVGGVGNNVVYSPPPENNVQPFLGIYHSIALTGIYPSRSSDPFLGEIRMFGFNFPPRGWAFCDGQLLPISSYTALFSLLGTTFGGDGITTFGLPDLRGRVPIHVGSGPGLSPYIWGQKGGVETITEPSHNHEHAL